MGSSETLCSVATGTGWALMAWRQGAMEKSRIVPAATVGRPLSQGEKSRRSAGLSTLVYGKARVAPVLGARRPASGRDRVGRRLLALLLHQVGVQHLRRQDVQHQAVAGAQ